MPDKINILINALAALGTLGAVVMALHLDNKKDTERERSIIVGLKLELKRNFFAIFQSGISEVEVDKQQEIKFRDNLHLFDPNSIKGIWDDLMDLYIYLREYEREWKNGIGFYRFREVRFNLLLRYIRLTGSPQGNQLHFGVILSQTLTLQNYSEYERLYVYKDKNSKLLTIEIFNDEVLGNRLWEMVTKLRQLTLKPESITEENRIKIAHLINQQRIEIIEVFENFVTHKFIAYYQYERFLENDINTRIETLKR